jgi:predicted O-linked N-acetylglucosamine transferase (SPINDLY family)
LQILAARPAPIQVHWLGYPGTLGAPYVDYLIGDPVVTPLAHAADYTENLVQLPHSYQSNDRARVFQRPPPRASLGLPAGASVFCCFNNSFKINVQVIDLWCCLLKDVPNSVLWLLARNDADPAIAHLRREAAARDVAPARLIFAAHRPQAEYLGLYEHADLFLDTWPYNAHTTASDALWVGCPVVTFVGETFASRVGASLLTAIGLTELVAADVAGYRALAIDLAGSETRRAALREYLQGPGRASPLFDAQAFARDLEVAFDAMAGQYREGRRAPIIMRPRSG